MVIWTPFIQDSSLSMGWKQHSFLDDLLLKWDGYCSAFILALFDLLMGFSTINNFILVGQGLKMGGRVLCWLSSFFRDQYQLV